MNEFEVKALLRNLKDPSIVKIHPVSKKYNKEIYNEIVSDVVIEHVYKETTYLQSVKFSQEPGYLSNNQSDNKIWQVQELLRMQRKEIEELLYDKELIYNEIQLVRNFFNFQLEVMFIKNMLPIPKKRDFDIEHIWKFIEKRIEENKSNHETYMLAMNMVKGMGYFNE